jgi:SpoVK/Ycf46/Vps4 family AAA+-type ATPase
MEVDEKPTEDYSQVGGLDKQIEELIEAVVLPITHAQRFKSLGIRPPKGDFSFIQITLAFFYCITMLLLAFVLTIKSIIVLASLSA